MKQTTQRIRSWLSPLLAAGFILIPFSAAAQPRSYIGFVYPAGGQRGTTFPVKLGGQALDEADEILITGEGVSAKITQVYRPLNPQEMQLLNEQLKELKQDQPELADDEKQSMIALIEKRTREYCNQPQCRALAALAFAEFTIAPDAPIGQRELRVKTLRGLSNPMVFHVGQLPEVRRTPMFTSPSQILGKEESALRKRPDSEIEQSITIPCIVNGQIASGEVNRYRFRAQKGQRLVIHTQARQLIPYLADAVPGWFQPVLALHNQQGKEVAYVDDYQFKPDPVLLYDVPADGEYVFAIYDSIYRGREDFVYRVTIGEVPFVTSVFPLGGRVGDPPPIQLKGWNLDGSKVTPPSATANPGIHFIQADKDGLLSNRIPFALDTLPECLEQEPNNSPSAAQTVSLPAIINGRVDRTDDRDVFAFQAQAGDTIVAEIHARRLDSPLDSVIKLTDASGKLLAFSDDVEDLSSGVNTHHADSYFMAALPGPGVFYVHVGDVARKGGEEYGYRLRLSAPRPDFTLHVVPSSLAFRSKGTGTVTVHAIRKDGFYGPIKVLLDDVPGFSATPVTLFGTWQLARFIVKTDLVATEEPVNLPILGVAKIRGQNVTNLAVPTEDRMQAFLWRHLVPAAELRTHVFDPSYRPPPKRIARERPLPQPKIETVSTNGEPAKPKFSKQQVAARLRQLKSLFEEGLLTDDFYETKVAECDAAEAAGP